MSVRQIPIKVETTRIVATERTLPPFAAVSDKCRHCGEDLEHLLNLEIENGPGIWCLRCHRRHGDWPEE